MSERTPLHVAVVIPPFRRGSGGHNSIFQMLSRLERLGHSVSIWLHDPMDWQRAEWPAVVRGNIREYFAPLEGPVFIGFDDWYGADVVVATGWQTVNAVLLLENVRARAYLVHDHESEFYATSAESWWAEQTYSLGMHPIAASPWLADLMARRYGQPASEFDFGVDHAVYHPREVTRRRDTILFYARYVTPRRAVPLGLLALQELHRRRPNLRIVLFGDLDVIDAPFPYEHLGIASPDQLAWAYSEATRRARAVDDQLLADPAGDAGLRAAVRRPRRLQRGDRLRRRRTRRARPVRPGRRSPTRSSGCSTTRRCGSGARSRGASSSPSARGTARPSSSRRACAPRCASASWAGRA